MGPGVSPDTWVLTVLAMVEFTPLGPKNLPTLPSCPVREDELNTALTDVHSPAKAKVQEFHRLSFSETWT